MAKPVIPPPAKLFIGILTDSDNFLNKAETVLTRKYGKIDLKTGKIQFSHTEYYSSIGKNLFKVFFSFERLFMREQIVKIKLFTNNLEKRISTKDKRNINIDPGYLTLSNVFLASCKDFFHRIYLDRGVYLENEYRYVGRQFQPWQWTYPDYLKVDYLDFFYDVRKTYYKQIRKKKH